MLLPPVFSFVKMGFMGALMSQKTFLVGQKVYIHSGVYNREGHVVNVTPSGVDVKSDSVLFRFDNDGKSCDGKGTSENGSWYLGDEPEDVPVMQEVHKRGLKRSPTRFR